MTEDEIINLVENTLNNDDLSISRDLIKSLVDLELKNLISDSEKISEAPLIQNVIGQSAATKSTEIIMKDQLEKVPVEEMKKIVMMGLSNAGKTCIYERVFEGKQPWQLLQSSATKGIEYKKFEVGKMAKPMVWDLGGQVRFRNMYLSDPRQYLSKTLLLIYVIDSQDEASAEEAAQYLDELLIKFKYLKETPKIYLTLHKYDPDLKKRDLKSSIDVIMNKLTPIFEHTSSYS